MSKNTGSKNSGRRRFVFESGAALLSAFSLTSHITASPLPFGINLLSESGALSDAFLGRMPELMELTGVPGLSIAIIKDGKLFWTREFGVKNATTKQPVESTTIFQAASLSKPVFAYAVLKMREEKLIDIDRPLNEYVPFPDIAEDARAKTITARHVMSHTTGLQNWRFGKNDKLALAFTPGERFGYSGEGFYHLQRVIEHISGKGIDEVMRERVFTPFGMQTSSYLWLAQHPDLISSGHNGRVQPAPAWSARQGPKMLELATKMNKPLQSWKHEDVVKAYAEIDSNLPPLPNFMIPNVAGSLLTTPSEYAKFLIRMMEEKPKDKFSLSEASRREMLTPQMKVNSALAWGLGWGLESVAGHTYFWHWGDNGIFKAFTINDLARRWGIMIMTNSTGGLRLSNPIVREVTGHENPAFLWNMVS